MEVSLNEPAPTDGCTIDLSYAYTLGSGGHGHYTVPQTETLIGKLSRNSVPFSKGERGSQSVTYTSGEIGGKFTITATESKTKASAAVTLEVKVPLFGELQSSSYYRLTGQTDKHSDNHYIEASAYENLVNIAVEYYESTGTTIGINDISLPWGGLFDIKGTWATNYHSSHRTGEDVDIDTYFYYDKGQIDQIYCGDNKDLIQITFNNQGALVCEDDSKNNISDKFYHIDF